MCMCVSVVLRATAACSCMRVLGTCVSTLSFLQFTFRRIRFYSIMQLACVFKYILEFSTLVETTRRVTLSSSFFHSEFRSRSPILAFPAFSRSRLSFTFTSKETAYLSHRSQAIEIVHEAVLDRNAWEVVRERGKRPQFCDNWRLHPWNPSSSMLLEILNYHEWTAVARNIGSSWYELRNLQRQAGGVLELVKCRRSLCHSSTVRLSLAARVNRSHISPASTILQNSSLSPNSPKCFLINFVSFITLWLYLINTVECLASIVRSFIL